MSANATIVIPVHNRREATLSCLRQLVELTPCAVDIHVIVVDDGSTDGTGDAIRQAFPVVEVVRGDGSLWWTGAINMGVARALASGSDCVIFLNDDLVLDRDWLSELVGVWLEERNSLVSGIKLRRMLEGDEIITAGFYVRGWQRLIENNLQGRRYDVESLPRVLTCDMLTGAALLVPSNVFRDIGLLDYRSFPHNWGDFEFTRRAALAGYKCLVATRSRVYGEYNPNYHRFYFVESTRLQYLRNLFNDRKFHYGFRATRKSAFMHRPFAIGLLVYFRQLLSLVKSIVMKLLLPQRLLRKGSGIG